MKYSKLVVSRLFAFPSSESVKYFRCRCYSKAAPASQPVELKLKKTPRVEREKKENKPPIIDNMFAGKFDRNILTYPQLENDRLESLKILTKPIEDFFSEKVDSKLIDSTGAIPPDIIEELKHLNVFGMFIPEIYGGEGLSATEYARVCESLGDDLSIHTMVTAHQNMGSYSVLVYGNEEQKQKYLPRLATGDWISAFCVTEQEAGNDHTNIQLTATLSADRRVYVLNGTKTWVTNGNIADLFTVFAKTGEGTIHERNIGRLTGFLVERTLPGITSSEPYDTVGVKGAGICTVHFKDTPVPVENVLGELNEGHAVLVRILSDSKHASSIALAGVLRKFIASACKHVINRNQFGAPLYEFEAIQGRFGKLTTYAYAIESMAYLTTSFFDIYENADCSVETAALKIFSTETCLRGIYECLQTLGCRSALTSLPYERYLRDVSTLLSADGSNDLLRYFIAMKGCQCCGNYIHTKVKALRNPFYNTRAVLRRLVEKMGYTSEMPSRPLKLNEYLHPSLVDPAELLELAIIRLRNVTEENLINHGQPIYERQMLLYRFADIAIDLYAMTAVLGRASRSYCIGLQDASHEILVAFTFCNDAYKRVDAALKDLVDGSAFINDRNYQNIGRRIFHSKSYFPQHPLTNNF